MTGWDWFDPDTAAKENDAGTHWQTCFASDAGQQVLRDLETQFVRSSLGPDAGQAALWMREGQRGLVLQMIRLASRETGE